LSEGQLPRADQEGEHKADQEVVEEFQCVADNGRGEDLELVAGQTRASIEYLEHGVSPRRMFVFKRASRLRTDNAAKATLSTPRTEARRYAGHLRANKNGAIRRSRRNRATADCGC
jgi:hypothetical protein